MILMEKLVEGTILYIYGPGGKNRGKVGVVRRSDDKFKYYTIYQLPEDVCIQDKVLFDVAQSRYDHIYANFRKTVCNEPDTPVRHNEPDTAVRHNEPDTVVRHNEPNTAVRRNEPDTAVSRDESHIAREKQDIIRQIISKKYGNEFLDKIVPIINRKLKEAPKTYEELGRNKHTKAIELIDETDKYDKCYAAMIAQRHPFFTSIYIQNPKSKTRYDPSYAVTLRLEDYNNLKGKYLDRGKKCLIYFWVHWNKKKTEYVTSLGEKIEITPFEGVWVADFAKIAAYIKKYNLPLKKYRNGDNVILHYYVFDLRDAEIFTQLLWRR